MTNVDHQKITSLGCWLLSLIVHLAFLLLVALLLRPSGQGTSRLDEIVVVMNVPDEVELDAVEFDAAPLQAEAAESPPLSHDITDAEDFRSTTEIDSTSLVGTRGAARRGRSAGAGSGSGAGSAEFFGTTAQGSRFVYLLDMSLSMDFGLDEQNTTRFDRAREELLRSIEQLHESQSFSVTLFCGQTRPMLDDSRYLHELMPATLENKARLRAWLQTIKTAPSTNPNEALGFAVGCRPHAVFLLSDGDFNGPPPKKNALFGEARSRDESADSAAQARVPIHTIAYEDAVGAKNMNDLSERSGGEYRFIEASAEAARNGNTSTLLVNLSERFAAKPLALGKGHEALGRRDEAIASYREVVAKHPQTSAAREATRRLERLTAEDSRVSRP